ncbi:MAG: 30S ribosomal protein S17 [Thermoanaerobaculia bacterium]|jgi:small subunit ribosomal protein S17
MSETTAKARGRRQELIGTVVSSKMNKTVVVTVENTVTHRLYHRAQKRTSKFYAHDEANACKPGDTVRLEASRPLSRLKRWTVREVLKKGEES